MVPPRADLRAARVVRPIVDERDVFQPGRETGPPLIDERRPAWREPGRDKIERVGLEPRREARRGDAEEFAVDHGQVVARRKTVRGVQDVGLAPSHELLADLETQRASRERGVEAPDGQDRAASPTGRSS